MVMMVYRIADHLAQPVNKRPMVLTEKYSLPHDAQQISVHQLIIALTV